MAQPQTQNKFISHEQYLEMEEYAEYKSEYYHGEIFAMSGASFNHNLIAGNIFSSLHTSLNNSDCFVFSSDMKIQVDEARHYTYPDLSIVCGNIEFVKNRNDTVTNPLAIVEVLSGSTKDYDRGGKFVAYRGIKSLKDYLIVDQYSFHIEYFFKNESGQWVLDEYDDMDAGFTLKSVNADLSMKEIYHRVKLKKNEK